ncbi:MAG: hypothetical protein ACOX6V_03830 [Patescibacteria group bacterium]|jgi:mevalonate kinase
MKSFIVSAPQSVSLLGDYSSYFQKPSLCLAVSPRVTVSFSSSKKGLQLKNSGSVSLQKACWLTEQAFDQFQQQGLVADFDVNLSLETIVPCLLKGTGEAFSLKWSKRKLFEMSNQLLSELLGAAFQPERSAAAIWGGTVFLNFTEEKAEVEPLKIKEFPGIFLQQSAKKRNTYKAVTEKNKEHPQTVTYLISRMGRLAEQGKIVLEQNQWERLGTLMARHQRLLHNLAFTSDKLHALCVTATLHGACGAKGWIAPEGEYVLAITSDAKSQETVKNNLKDSGKLLFPEKQGLAVVKD